MSVRQLLLDHVLVDVNRLQGKGYKSSRYKPIDKEQLAWLEDYIDVGSDDWAAEVQKLPTSLLRSLYYALKAVIEHELDVPSKPRT